MIKEILPTEEFLKAITGKFELETIFILELQNKNITKLSGIPNCKSLILLNLSKNNLTSVSGISTLKNLNFLDLSFNHINSIDGIEKLINLRHLKLHGNNISHFPSHKFSALVRLEKLTFEVMRYKDDKELNTTNPICKKEDYRKKMFELFCSLKMLDGITQQMEPFSIEEDKEDHTIEEKFNEKLFDFDFSNKITFKIDDIISDSDIRDAKKNIDEKFDEFERSIEELRRGLKEIK